MLILTTKTLKVYKIMQNKAKMPDTEAFLNLKKEDGATRPDEEIKRNSGYLILP